MKKAAEKAKVEHDNKLKAIAEAKKKREEQEYKDKIKEELR